MFCLLRADIASQLVVYVTKVLRLGRGPDGKRGNHGYEATSSAC